MRRGWGNQPLRFFALHDTRSMRRTVLVSLLVTASCALLPTSVAWRRRSSPVPRPTLLAATIADDMEPMIDLTAAKDIKVKEPLKAKLLAGGYLLYALGFALLLVKTLKAFPLIPPSANSLAWCRTWLGTTVADYYGAALALCGVIVCTEPKLHGASCPLLQRPACTAHPPWVPLLRSRSRMGRRLLLPRHAVLLHVGRDPAAAAWLAHCAAPRRLVARLQARAARSMGTTPTAGVAVYAADATHGLGAAPARARPLCAWCRRSLVSRADRPVSRTPSVIRKLDA